MVEFKGTKGNWQVSNRGKGYVETQRGDIIASVYADTNTRLQDYSEENTKELLYNTKLIASAPEMLEIIKDLSENLELQLGRLGCCGHGDGKDHKADNDSFGGGDLLIRSREIIKKATE